MTALTLSTSSATTLRADAVVVGVAKTTEGPRLAPGAETVDTAYGNSLADTLGTLGATGAETEVTKLPAPDDVKSPMVLAVGLGRAPEDGSGFPEEALRRAAGAAARALAGSRKAAFALPVADADAAGAIGQGALLGAYQYTVDRDAGGDPKGSASKKDKKSDGAADTEPLAEVAIVGADSQETSYQQAVERATVLAEEQCRARDLVNAPSNDLDPSAFAAQVQTAAKEHGLKVEVLDEKALSKGGFGGILGVSQGSATPPRLVKVSYRASKAESSLSLVGKGITYDSGGISLKPAGHNETMKCDMAGAAAVFATVVAAARLGLRANVTGWLALAENMPSGSATRPGDVLRMYGDTTVEVLNTDAEGRLVMADALARACEEEPDALLDVATLTGAMVVALGERTFGVLGNDDALRGQVVDAAGRAGEPAWALPMPEELRSELDSPIADLKNVGSRMGGGLLAGVFLQEFVTESTSWAHVDIAGPAFNESAPFGYTPKGGTGSAVRTLLHVAENAAEGQLRG